MIGLIIDNFYQRFCYGILFSLFSLHLLLRLRFSRLMFMPVFPPAEIPNDARCCHLVDYAAMCVLVPRQPFEGTRLSG